MQKKRSLLQQQIRVLLLLDPSTILEAMAVSGPVTICELGKESLLNVSILSGTSSMYIWKIEWYFTFQGWKAIFLYHIVKILSRVMVFLFHFVDMMTLKYLRKKLTKQVTPSLYVSSVQWFMTSLPTLKVCLKCFFRKRFNMLYLEHIFCGSNQIQRTKERFPLDFKWNYSFQAWIVEWFQ